MKSFEETFDKVAFDCAVRGDISWHSYYQAMADKKRLCDEIFNQLVDNVSLSSSPIFGPTR
ncbi:hypothetical protein LCGC14_3054440 [marine sediment metagenome]|uniref:Uncharacterized protein n=1 Tax=marine sediment metagenome TaxID=412755 RepID=A0A0F8X912_9ZZZZ